MIDLNNFTSASEPAMNRLDQFKSVPYPKVSDKADAYIKGMRRSTGKISPLAEGIVGATIGTLDDIGTFLVDTTPALKWSITKDRREQFLALDPEEKKRAIMHEAFSAALWAAVPVLKPVVKVAAPFVAKGFRKGVSGASPWMQKALKKKMVPIEDSGSWIAKSYGGALEKKLSKMKLHKDEAEAVKDFLYSEGNTAALGRPVLNNKVTNSKTYLKMLERNKNVAHGYTLTDDAARELIASAFSRKIREEC